MQISTWQRWLGNFGFGWGFLETREGACSVLGRSCVSAARVVNLGAVSPADIRVSPEPLVLSKAHKQNKKKAPSKQKPTVEVLNICIWRENKTCLWLCLNAYASSEVVSLSSAPSPFFSVILALSFLLFHPSKVSSSLDHVLFLTTISLMREPSHSGQLEPFLGRMLLQCQEGCFLLLPPKQFHFNSLYLL